jgi:hypothetical protein
MFPGVGGKGFRVGTLGGDGTPRVRRFTLSMTRLMRGQRAFFSLHDSIFGVSIAS